MDINKFIQDKYGLGVSEVIDTISRSSGYGNITSNYQQVLRGLNHRGMGNPVSKTLENVGITLITRPYCNLTYDNLKMVRLLTPLMTEDERSIQRYIRATLDPRSNKGINVPEKITSPYVNEHQPFIPLLTNTILSTSGWPDILAKTYTSPEGLFKENRTMIDSHHKILNNWSLNMTLRNVDGDPLTYMFYALLIYACSIRIEGDDFVPYPDSIINTRIDYEMGIWHLVLDPTKQYLVHIARTIGSPINCPIGATFNQQNEQHMVTSKDQVSLQFSCNGAEYNDPMLVYEFNRLAAIYDNRLIIDQVLENDIVVRGETSGGLIKLRPDEIPASNYYGRMLIHPYTGKIFWYLSDFEFNEINRRI